MDDGSVFKCSLNTNGYLLGIRTEVVKRVYGTAAFVIVEVSPDDVVFQHRVVGVGVGTIAATVNISADAGVHTYGITEIHLAGDVIAAIHILYVAAAHQYTGSHIAGEVVTYQILYFHHGDGASHVAGGIDISFATTAIYVLYYYIRTLWYLKQQSVATGHTTFVTAAVQVVYAAIVQVPGGTDMHVVLVVAAKHTEEVHIVDKR